MNINILNNSGLSHLIDKLYSVFSKKNHTHTKSDVGLSNVGNYKAVSTVASQGLTDTEKSNARNNIGAGTSNFNGDYNSLSNKPTIPTKTSQLTNDSGYKTTDNNTTYTLTQDATDGHKITLTPSFGTAMTVTIPDNNTTYGDATTSSHGLMTSTMVSKLNGIADGANKTTVDGSLSSTSTNPVQNKVVNSALNGKANSSHTHNSADIVSLDAAKLTGTIDIARLPQGALDRLVRVADDTARFALTTDDIQLGDTVKVISTGKMYYVVDETKLSSEDGYEPYAADTAISVPWSGVTGKPSSYTPSSHTHDDRYYTETEMNTKLAGKSDTGHKHTKSEITDFPSSMPASDVYTWAKASSKPSYTASEVGLGNVDNTADANKSVKSSTKLQTYKQGSITETYGNNYPVYAQWEDSSKVKLKCDNYTVKTDYANTSGNSSTVNGHTVNSDVPANAKFTDTNTWRGIQDNLTSTSTTDSLSANQGKVLKGLIDGKTSNTGTITGINMNGSSKGTSGVVDLGTVLTGGKQTTTSTTDGGSNVYTFSDNSTITVKNGSKGSAGSNGTSAAWFTGTAVTGTSTSATAFTVSGSKAGDMYLNTSTYNVYRASAANSWVYVCNIKGATGSSGTNGTNGTNGVTPTIKAAEGSNINTVGTPSVTASTSGTTTTFTFNNLKGQSGSNGTRGSVINFGTAITGTSTTATIYSSSGLTSSLVNDMYLNTSTFNLYKCTIAGAASTAKWVYVGCIKGTNGTNATTTSVATTSANGLMSKDMVTKLNGIATGATAVSDATVSGWGYKKTDTNTWRPLGTTADTACAGNDSRLSNARPASDVYSWAKESSPDNIFKGGTYTGNIDSYANDTLQPGKSYYINTSNITSSYSLPFSGYGVLSSCVTASVIIQQIFKYNGSSKIVDGIYTRMYINSTWTYWSKGTLTKV